MELFFAVSLKLWDLGLRWYFVSMVPGSVECMTCCLLYITLVNSWSSASSTSSSTVLWCVHRGQNGCDGEWQLVVVFGRRPSRSPTMSSRRTRASRRRLTWRWCGPKQLSCRGTWVFAGHRHFVNMKDDIMFMHIVLVTVAPRIFMTSTRRGLTDCVNFCQCLSYYNNKQVFLCDIFKSHLMERVN